MNALYFKHILIIALCFAFNAHVFSRDHLSFNRLVPDHSRVQYAGSMGMVSLSIGYQYWQHHLETDLVLGYIPKQYGFDIPLVFTLKQSIIPIKWKLSNAFYLQPFTLGFYINRVHGNRFYMQLPSQYPDGYYWWQNEVRFHVFVGFRLGLIELNQAIPFHSVEWFGEFHTNDLYICSSLENSRLGLKDIMKFTTGIKFNFRSAY